MLYGLKAHRARNPIFDEGAMPCICKCGMLVNGGQWNPKEQSARSTLPFLDSTFRSSVSISWTGKKTYKTTSIIYSHPHKLPRGRSLPLSLDAFIICSFGIANRWCSDAGRMSLIIIMRWFSNRISVSGFRPATISQNMHCLLGSRALGLHSHEQLIFN